MASANDDACTCEWTRCQVHDGNPDGALIASLVRRIKAGIWCPTMGADVVYDAERALDELEGIAMAVERSA